MEPFDDISVFDQSKDTRTYRFRLAGGDLTKGPRPNAVVNGNKLKVTINGTHESEVEVKDITSVVRIDVKKESVDVTVKISK